MSGLIRTGLSAVAGVFTGGSSVWLPYVIVGGLGLAIGAGGTAWVASYIVDGAEKAEKAANDRADLLAAQHKADETGLSDRDAAIASLNAEINKITVDATNSTQAALARAAEAEDRATNSEAVIADLKRKSHAAAPQDQPKPLSPYARLGAQWLLCKQKAGAGSAPAACAGKTGLSAD